jgi:hypothetical protein
MKNELITIIMILLTVSIFGCTSNQSQSNSSIYGSTYVNFQMPNGWELHPMPGNGTVIWMKGDPRIRVIEQKDEQEFNLKYSNALKTDKDVYTLITGNKNINGINVNFIKTMSNNEGNIDDLYFFTKNNKYYILEGWAYNGWNAQTSDRKKIDNAVETIVNTIN